MNSFLLLFTFITLSTSVIMAQGRLLIVGGGNEKNGQSSWSTAAYRWAGEGKNVAIIGISTGSLAPYFENQCGAARAKEFAINSIDSANSQITYDTLTTYDVIFFRGGDQYDYYSLYRNTKLQDAVNFVFSQGGTIGGTSAGMHILSSIVFTAENGTVYPYECIENPDNQYITLADDFFDFFPGYIFDTHFAERGRFGRLLGFLANYYFNQGISITGLGMDDMTCMTVEANGLGTVYGTGCANVYIAGNNFSQNGLKLLADTVEVMQLLQGCTYNFLTGEAGFEGLDLQIHSSEYEETGNYTVLASGADNLSSNLDMLNDLVNNCGNPSDEILLLSGDLQLAGIYQSKLLELGAGEVNLYTPNLSSGSDPQLETKINSAPKILFLKNDLYDFLYFLETQNGTLLQQKIKADGMITAFSGDNARFIGKTIVDNYLTEGASYYAELIFEKGLSLLKHSVIMPNTYLNGDVYENTSTAVPYAMVMDTLKFGIWLTNHNYMKFTPIEGKTTLTGYGTAPVMVVSNAGTNAGISSQTSTGSTSIPPRMVAGFEHLQLSLIDFTNPLIMGNVQSAGIHQFEENNATVAINPLSPNQIRLEWKYAGFSWIIFDMNGKKIQEGRTVNKTDNINIFSLRSGIYIIHVVNNKMNIHASARFIIKSNN